MKGSKSSKGFFFVLVSFIMLLYVSAYLIAWTRSLEISEKVASEKFRDSSLGGVFSQMNEQRFSDFLDMAGYYALFRINDYASYDNQTLKYAEDDELQYLKSSLGNMLLNGSSRDFQDRSGAPVELDYNASERGAYTFGAFLTDLNYSLSQTGLEVKSFNVSDFNLTQIDAVTFNASLRITLFIDDRLSAVSINRSMTLSRVFSVSGFPDPMILRETRKINDSSPPIATADFKPAERQIFYSSLKPGDLAPRKYALSGTQGQGFFYGQLVDAKNPGPGEENRSESILVGNFSDIIDVENYSDFGAYIITNHVAPLPSEDPAYLNWQTDKEDDTFMQISFESFTCRTCGTACTKACPQDAFCDDILGNPNDRGNTVRITDPRHTEICAKDGNRYEQVSGYKLVFLNPTPKPFAVIENLNINDFSETGGWHRALFIANYSVEEVARISNGYSNISMKFGTPLAYDIEALRDAAACSNFYNVSSGPSYMRRLSSRATDSGITSQFGMEAMLVGKWAGGEQLPVYDGYSRADFEFFDENNGVKVRGLPGCKNPWMCSIPTGENAPLGHFALSTDSLTLYGAASIACNDGRAGCG